MPNTTPPTRTTSEQFNELGPLLEAFRKDLLLRLSHWTARHEVQAVRKFIAHLILGKKHYQDVTRQDVEVYLALQKAKPHTNKQTLYSIKRFYHYLIETGILRHNPAGEITMRLRKPRVLTFAPAVAQIKAVFRKLEKDESPAGLRNRLMVELAYGSGLRAGEIAMLNAEDVNSQDRTAHVTGKGRKTRVVPLTGRCLALWEGIVRSGTGPRQPVFTCGNGQRMTPPAVSQAIKQKTGYNAHLFRHACAAHMLKAGCNVRYIQELLGHERPDTTQTYTALCKEDLRIVLNQNHPGGRRSAMPNNPEEKG